MPCEELRLSQRDAHRVVVVQQANPHVFDGCAEAAENVNRGIDCAAQQFAVLSYEDFDERGALIASETIATPSYEAIQSGTIVETLMSNVCK